MIVYPAIDIHGGRCVRLVEGDFSRETTFDAEPADAARRWADAGAEWLHVVDLDGAVAGHPNNLNAINAIVAAVSIPVQLGGGLRSADDVRRAFDSGVTRAILGTAAIRDASLVAELAARHPGRIAVGLDARDGKLAAGGWLDQTEMLAVEAARSLTAAGIDCLIYTDIRRDGTLVGPNLPALTEMIDVAGGAVIASGGVGEIEHVDQIAATGAGGVIIGRALYDGRVDLTEAMRRARSGVPT